MTKLNKIAVILAHPDDAEIWIGGTILNHVNSGDKITVFYLFADSENRRKEAVLFSNITNINVIFPKSKDILRHHLKKVNPNIIITHWERDSHIEHRMTYDIVSSLIPKLMLEDNIKFNLYLCDTYNSIGQNNEVFIPNTYIDISNTWVRKTKIIMNHKSQPTNYWIHMIHNQNKLYGLRNNVDVAEAFIQINTLGFVYNNNKFLK